MYTWHEKHYVGAAHGIVGIIYMLLQVKNQMSGLHMVKLTKVEPSLMGGHLSVMVLLTNYIFNPP